MLPNDGIDEFKNNMLKLKIQGFEQISFDQILKVLKNNGNDAYFSMIELNEEGKYDYLSKRYPSRFEQ